MDLALTLIPAGYTQAEIDASWEYLRELTGKTEEQLKALTELNLYNREYSS